MGLSICPSPPFIMSRFSAEEARELCRSAALAVISNLVYAIFIFIFAVVGATLGTLAGALIGAKTNMGVLHGAIAGAIKGSFFSIKLLKISLIVCRSDDTATRHLLQEINAFVSSSNEVACNMTEALSKDSIKGIPKIRITEENVWDSSRNRISCSICLQEFLQGEIVHSLPHCHHMFHVSCTQKWLKRHKSCPLCRRNF